MFDPVRHLSGVAFAAELDDLVAPGMRVLDVGTGCGILAGVAAQLGATVVATDINERAVVCAQQNLDGLDVDVRCGDLFEPVAGERFDLIVCNPPYESGGSSDLALASPDFLTRFDAAALSYADRIVLAFPADDSDRITELGLRLGLWRRVPTRGLDLGIFVGPT